MGEKIFGEIQKTEELNELANNLRKSKEFDEIRLLCSENNIPAEIAEKFIKGDLLILAEMGYLERIRKGLLISAKQEPQAEPGQQPEKEKPIYTIADVKKKLEAELAIYRDGDSKYVIEKLIELCSTDKELLNCIMLPHKSYDKAFQYFFEKSRIVGYKMPHGNMVYLDNDRAVELSVQYFKKDDAAEAKHKTNKKKERTKTQSQPQKKSEEKFDEVKQKEMKTVDLEADKPKQEIKPKKNEMSGQLSLFDF